MGPRTAAAIATENQGPSDWWALLANSAFLGDPYPQLARLRALSPIHFDTASGVYFVLGHKEFAQVSKSAAFGRDTRLWAGGWNSPDYADA